ncbi:Rv3654c family TadE-like protein [Streptomyces sp. NPDC090108]|uniref:Rv3654c family TadE-like protein n=1 Tax=Streptomyces sp. NPDC090108 TaxID=3365947 RepID=UPI0038172953
MVFGAVLALGQAVVVRHRAAAAADLAALVAADHWAEGEAGACGRAERLAAVQGARVVRCSVTGEISDVTAGAGGGPFAAEVRARAGPALTPPQSLSPRSSRAPETGEAPPRRRLPDRRGLIPGDRGGTP